MICPKSAAIMWPKERVVWRGRSRYDMGPDTVKCVYETSHVAEYHSEGKTPEGWNIRITAYREDGNVYEKVGQKYAIRWGFVD